MKTFHCRFVAVSLIALATSIAAFCGEIHDAARDGDLATVKALLKNRPELVSSKNNNSLNMPLHVAAQNGYKDMVELLLAYEADVNAKNRSGFEPLHLATQNGHKNVVELLLANKANVNARDFPAGMTPLHMAAMKGHKDISELLLANKAGINARIEDVREFPSESRAPISVLGCTPLHLAAEFHHKDVVELLLAKGANVNAKDHEGDTPLRCAAESGYKGAKDVLELLLAKGAEINAKNYSGDTPLHSAAVWRLAYKTFLMGGISDRSIDNEKEYQFKYNELERQQCDVVELLLTKGADVNAMNNSGETPLYLALHEGIIDKIPGFSHHLEGVVGLLFANKADVDARNNKSEPALRKVLELGHKNIVELLRQHGGHE
jgi:ankyrin repeat protein